MGQAFAHITAENAGLYRVIMRVFMQAKERFVFHLRLEEVVEGLRTSGALELPDSPEPQIEYALALLCEWGNLQTCRRSHPPVCCGLPFREFPSPEPQTRRRLQSNWLSN